MRSTECKKSPEKKTGTLKKSKEELEKSEKTKEKKVGTTDKGSNP